MGYRHNLYTFTGVARAAAITRGAELGYQNAFVEAWEAAVLYQLENPDCEEWEVYRAALYGVQRERDKRTQLYGRGERFWLYWSPRRAWQPDVLQKIALEQVMAALEPKDAEILEHFKQFDTIAEAARNVSWPESTYRVAVRNAAKRARELWFDFEQAPQITGGRRRTKTHCAQGHEFTSENTQWVRNKGRLTRRCATCNRERQAAVRAARRERLLKGDDA